MAIPKAAAFCSAVSVCAATTVSAANGLGGGGPFGEQTTPCMTAADWANAAQGIAEYEQRFGPISSPDAALGTPPLYPFYPMGGILYRDLWISNFVDLDAGPAILDWNCLNFTYNGHNASDSIIRSFGEQFIGVPIFAALDGTVVDTNDGEDDMNIVWEGQPANYVIIDHGFGRLCYYWHMKKWSVAVSVGEQVVAGQQIGKTASSGNSNYPHLHFATYDDEALIEPWAGPCRAGESYWEDQVAPNYDLYLWDFGFTAEDMSSFPGPPNAFPRSGQIGLGDQRVYFWTMALNLPHLSTYRVQFERPDSTIAYDSGTGQLGNFGFSRYYWDWWDYDIPDMHSITGTWHVWLYLNDVLQVVAPIEVRTAVTQDFNRAPEPISIAFDPAAPMAGDAIFCNVQTSLTLDDMDYDIVQYEYVWTVNDAEVRHVTTAGHADAIQRWTANECDAVTVTVTPGDGVDTGSTESISVVVGTGPCPQCDGDVDADGTVGINDFLALLGAWGPCPDPPATCFADIDGDGTVGINDFLAQLANWGPCP